MQTVKQKIPQIAAGVLFTLFVLILAAGFLNNVWGTVGKKFFSDWRLFKDANFVGRLVQSEHEGLFSNAGFLGWGDESSHPDSADLVMHQYATYLASRDFKTEDFKTYNSAINFQGFLFGLLDQILKIPPHARLFFFEVITSSLTAIVLGLFAAWVYCEFGWLASLSVSGFMLLSEWITIFGGSIYWSLWAVFLPFVAISFHVRANQQGGKIGNNLFKLIFLSVLAKFLFNGFEYVTVVLLMVFVPLAYYALLNRWKPADMRRVFMKAIYAEGLATITALLTLFIQNAIVLGGAKQAVAYLLFSLEKRSIGNPDAFISSPTLRTSLTADLWGVIKGYMIGRAVNLDLGFLLARLPGWEIKRLEVSYQSVFIFFLSVSALCLVFQALTKRKDIKLANLVIITWLSALAPLSWLVIFKAHSYLHYHLNFIIWQMPFTLLGFAMCGATFQFFIEQAHAAVFKQARRDDISARV